MQAFRTDMQALAGEVAPVNAEGGPFPP
jgi:hypothetical protein